MATMKISVEHIDRIKVNRLLNESIIIDCDMCNQEMSDCIGQIREQLTGEEFVKMLKESN